MLMMNRESIMHLKNSEEFEEQIKWRSAFSFNDFFGKGRIRNLMYEYKHMLDRKNAEIKELKTIVEHQSITIDFFADKCMAQQKEYEKLKDDYQKLEAAFDRLFKQKYSIEGDQS